ncbi:MAG: hypothetical protein CBD58_03080 [bacterium TMED198]|nr:MAG: hypothetical protein CBD58_03080 [bacterium TMED198]
MYILLYLSYLLIISSFVIVSTSIIYGQVIFFMFDSNYVFFDSNAFFGSMLYSITQSFVLFYIVGLSRGIVSISNLPQNRSKKILNNKSKNYSHTMLSVLIVGSAYIIAGAVDNEFLDPYFYIILANLGLIHYLILIKWQHKALKDCILTLKSIEPK